MKFSTKYSEFFEFVTEIIIPKMEEFVVKEFYKFRKGIIKMSFDTNFQVWILDPMKDMELSLRTETKLMKSAFKNSLSDPEIQQCFSSAPAIPVKIFLAQLKVMLEKQPYGFSNGYKSHNFLVKIFFYLCRTLFGVVNFNGRRPPRLDGLYYKNSFHNVFHVDLTEIGDRRVVTVYAGWLVDAWYIVACNQGDKYKPWTKGNFYYSNFTA